jgi:hypothetical protein
MDGTPQLPPASRSRCRRVPQGEAGAKLTDPLHAGFTDEVRQTDLTGWTAAWDAYWQPITDDDPRPRIVADASGTQPEGPAIRSSGGRSLNLPSPLKKLLVRPILTSAGVPCH